MVEPVGNERKEVLVLSVEINGIIKKLAILQVSFLGPLLFFFL
jgi:hypothetical protein